MLISVIPSSHSISTTPLTYSVGDVFRSQIQVGSLVEIPLGKNKEYGIVAGIAEYIQESYEIRPIIQVVCSTPLLASYQIHLILSIARRYMIPIHRVLGFFFTRPTLSRLEKSNFGGLAEVSHVSHDSNGRIIFLQNTIVTPTVLSEYISERTVIVCPDDISLFQYQKAFEDSSYFFLPNEATDAKRSKAWRDIRNGLYSTIFSTRKILFFNLERYQHILYLEDAFVNEYFHYPTYIHYNDILKSLDETKQFQIDILTSIPLLRTLVDFRHFEIKNIA